MQKVDREEIKLLTMTWVAWVITRRFFAPPIPINMLARMQVDKRISGEPPDAMLVPLCSAFNLVLSGAEEDERLPFLYVYLKQYRPKPIKTLAHDLGIDSDTVYCRAHNSAIKFYNMAQFIADSHSRLERQQVDLCVD